MKTFERDYLKYVGTNNYENTGTNKPVQIWTDMLDPVFNRLVVLCKNECIVEAFLKPTYLILV
jgi:hypothetical protein